MKLVIVESPNKCHTISRYLGDGYKVIATKGIIRDLATSGKGGYGVDVKNNFKPTYKICSSKFSTVNEIKKEAKNASEVILATDPDREGEAIAFSVAEVLGLNPKTNKRLEFHEITRESIDEAINNPKVIDMDLVNSQETRRIIDRILGFKLTSLIQKRIKSKSAGRVQSATLKLICDHDEEIKNFIPEEYWKISFESTKNNKKFTAHFLSYKDIKKISSKDEDELIIKNIGKTAKIIDVKQSFRTTESKPAFTTSTLQQEAYNVYGFSTKRTASVSQKLYEGIEVNGEHVGLITYIRTDSTYLSNTYVEHATAYLLEKYGKEYVGKRKTVKVVGAQNAHEAIRPTSNHRTPESIARYLSKDEYKLYKLIYERTLSSLMTAKKESVVSIRSQSNDVIFESKGSKVIFDGYTKLYKSDANQEDELPLFNIGDVLNIENLINEQDFTKPPAPYSEGKIVKLMEEKNIGRPSTYASTIDTLVKRGYVVSDKGVITSTEQGRLTSFVLNKYCPDLINVQYTADMESDLDKIQDGEVDKLEILNKFYDSFTDIIEDASKKMYEEPKKEVGRNCPICGAPLVYNNGKYGEFVACSAFPKCKYTEKQKKEVIVIKKCPDCGGDLILKGHGRKKFLGCSNYPECKHIEQYKENKKSK